ncbi:MAG: M48 family metalloprotease [Sphingomonadaceae bacterium]
MAFPEVIKVKRALYGLATFAAIVVPQPCSAISISQVDRVNKIALSVFEHNSQECKAILPEDGGSLKCYRRIIISQRLSGPARTKGDFIVLNKHWLGKLDDDQLAFVIAHELAHFIINERVEILSNSSSRSIELEADYLAAQTMINAGRDLERAKKLMQRIEGARILSFPFGLLSHPGARTRIAAIEHAKRSTELDAWARNWEIPEQFEYGKPAWAGFLEPLQFAPPDLASLFPPDAIAAPPPAKAARPRIGAKNPKPLPPPAAAVGAVATGGVTGGATGFERSGRTQPAWAEVQDSEIIGAMIESTSLSTMPISESKPSGVAGCEICATDCAAKTLASEFV